jgi:hypothetical protein
MQAFKVHGCKDGILVIDEQASKELNEENGDRLLGTDASEITHLLWDSLPLQTFREVCLRFVAYGQQRGWIGSFAPRAQAPISVGDAVEMFLVNKHTVTPRYKPIFEYGVVDVTETGVHIERMSGKRKHVRFEALAKHWLFFDSKQPVGWRWD